MSIYRLDSSNHFHCINGCNFILRIMKSKQVLSIEQMKHLQELGLDTGDASMYWKRVSHGSRIDDKSKGKWFLSLQKEFQTCGFMSYETLPTYTLQDIIRLLPESIMDDKNEMYKGTKYWYYLTITPSWVVSYDEGKGFLEPIKCCISESLLEASYNMLCWCAENGYLETK